MLNQNTIYLITSDAEAGTMETLPLIEELLIISNDHFEKGKITFEAHHKVCITSESSIESVSDRIDIDRSNAIKVLKDKFAFREILSKIYSSYKYKLIHASEIDNLMIDVKSVIKPSKGCFGTAVRIIEPSTDFRKLNVELKAELLKNGSIFSESVLSKDYFIVEQFIEGEEYAVDMFYNSKGEACIINIFHHPMPANKAYLHMIYYSSKTVFDKIYDKSKLFFTQLNNLLGVTNFVMHCEFKLQGEDLLPIEINAMRFGGMGLGNLVFHSLNVNPYLYYLNDHEPDWQNIWAESKNSNVNFTFFIAYNSQNKSLNEYHPNYEKMKQQFTEVLLEQRFDYKRQLAFAIYCLKETENSIQKLLEIEFDNYFTPGEI